MPVKLTNHHNLPEIIVRAVKNDPYTMTGDISVTTLIDSPRIKYLKKVNTYEEDVSDRLNSLMGTALHHILEMAQIENVRTREFISVANTIMQKAKSVTDAAKQTQLNKAAKYILDLIPAFFPEIDNDYIFEIRFTLSVDGMEISGKFDVYHKPTKTLYDYKQCKVFSYLYPESRKKWAEQTNIYAYMLEENGYPVENIKIVAFFKDWSRGSFLRDANYPKQQIITIDVPLEPLEKTFEYIQERVRVHKLAETEMPLCTGAERWAKADSFAVKNLVTITGYKNKLVPSKKALNNGIFATKQEAEFFRDENNHKYAHGLMVEFRPGESRRCAEWCQVAMFCDQRQAELKRVKDLSDNE